MLKRHATDKLDYDSTDIIDEKLKVRRSTRIQGLIWGTEARIITNIRPTKSLRLIQSLCRIDSPESTRKKSNDNTEINLRL